MRTHAHKIHHTTNINILFSGYKGCYANEEMTNHEEVSANAWANVSGNRILILTYTRRNDLPNGDFDEITRTTTHEILHTLGVGHCDDGKNCIMLKSGGTVTTELMMCNECQSIANGNKLTLYYH